MSCICLCLSCDIVARNVTLRTLGMAESAGKAYECLLCRSPLNISSKRRVVHPRNASNTDVHNFVLDSLCRGWRLPVDDTVYTCRTPCFADLQKASNHQRALAGFMEKFLKQLKYKETESTMDVSFPSL
jgi:hypothetical protein